MSKNKTARILVADDEPAIRESLATVLTKEGYSCKAVASGDEAIAVFDEDPFDIVITDIQMPGADGIKVLQEIMRRHPKTRVIIVTAYGTVERAVGRVVSKARASFVHSSRNGVVSRWWP